MKKNVPAKQARPIRQSRPDDKTIFGTWIDGYTTGDVGRIMSIFSEDLRYIAPCEPEQTFESLTNWFKYDVARKGPRPAWTFRTESVDWSGNLAVIVSTWSAVTDFGGFQAEVHRLRSIDFLARYGPDALRYFICAAGPETSDAAFTWADFVTRNNSELVAGWGNLVNRTATMIAKNFG